MVHFFSCLPHEQGGGGLVNQLLINFDFDKRTQYHSLNVFDLSWVLSGLAKKLVYGGLLKGELNVERCSGCKPMHNLNGFIIQDYFKTVFTTCKLHLTIPPLE